MSPNLCGLMSCLVLAELVCSVSTPMFFYLANSCNCHCSRYYSPTPCCLLLFCCWRPSLQPVWQNKIFLFSYRLV